MVFSAPREDAPWDLSRGNPDHVKAIEESRSLTLHSWYEYGNVRQYSYSRNNMINPARSFGIQLQQKPRMKAPNDCSVIYRTDLCFRSHGASYAQKDTRWAISCYQCPRPCWEDLARLGVVAEALAPYMTQASDILDQH